MLLDHMMATVREQGYWRGMLLDHMMATVREQGYWRGMLLDHMMEIHAQGRGARFNKIIKHVVGVAEFMVGAAGFMAGAAEFMVSTMYQGVRFKSILILT
jgi:hypothetical protein